MNEWTGIALSVFLGSAIGSFCSGFVTAWRRDRKVDGPRANPEWFNPPGRDYQMQGIERARQWAELETRSQELYAYLESRGLESSTAVQAWHAILDDAIRLRRALDLEYGRPAAESPER